MQVTTWLPNLAFHLGPIRLRTLVVIDSESCQTLIPTFCAPTSEVAVLFYLNPSRRSFSGRSSNKICCFAQDSENEDLLLLIETMSADLVCNNFSPIPSKILFHMKKSDSSRREIYKALNLWLSNWLKSCSMFYSSEPVATRIDCSRLGNALCLCLPVQPV